MSQVRPGGLTGRHIAAIFVTFFGVVIAVNIYMATMATSTFGGVVVENSYVAGQQFNRWLDEAAKARALGWSASTTRRPDGRLAVRIAGEGADGAVLTALARHPLGRLPEQALTFARAADGSLVSREVLAEGRWTLRLEARSGEQLWRAEEDLR